jgi:NAD(P)H-flavin reductase
VIAEDAIKRTLERPLYLYWGARRAEDLYLAALAQKWHDSGRVKFVTTSLATRSFTRADPPGSA